MINLGNGRVMVAIDERCPASDAMAKASDGCGHAPAYWSINPGSHLDGVAIENHRACLFQDGSYLFWIANLGRAMTEMEIGKNNRWLRSYTHPTSPTTLTAIDRCVGRRRCS